MVLVMAGREQQGMCRPARPSSPSSRWPSAVVGVRTVRTRYIIASPAPAGFPMLHSYLRAVRIALLAGCLCPVGMLIAGSFAAEYTTAAGGVPLPVFAVGLACVAVAIFGLADGLLRRRETAIAALAEKQATFLDTLPEEKLRGAVALSAGSASSSSWPSSAGTRRCWSSSPSTRTSACWRASPGWGWATRSPRRR